MIGIQILIFRESESSWSLIIVNVPLLEKKQSKWLTFDKLFSRFLRFNNSELFYSSSF